MRAFPLKRAIATTVTARVLMIAGALATGRLDDDALCRTHQTLTGATVFAVVGVHAHVDLVRCGEERVGHDGLLTVGCWKGPCAQTM